MQGYYDNGDNRNYDYELVNLNFDSTYSDGNLWVYPTQISSMMDGEDIENYSIYGFIIEQDGKLSSGTVSYRYADGSRQQVGVCIGDNYKCLRAYNCFRSATGSDIVFAYGNDINVNNKLDSIISSLQQNSQGFDEVIDNATQNSQDIQDNQDKNTQAIIDNDKALQENEKFEAEETGNSGVDSVSDSIPDYASDVSGTIGRIFNKLRTTATDCVIEFPGLKIPAISNYFPEIVLLNPQNIDVEAIFNKMPALVIKLLRAFCGICLYLYMVKEVYSIIAYVMTLRGNND